MKTYARIHWSVDKSASPLDSSKWVNVYYVAEIIPPMAYDADSIGGVEPLWKAGDEIPIERRYNVALMDGTISYMADITDLNPQPHQYWGAARDNAGNWVFSAPHET
jgi:hypothetical protein